MDKILETYKDIIVNSRKNTTKTFCMAIIFIIIIITGALMTIKLFSLAQSNTIILDYDGHVRQAKHISPDEASIIKVQAFIDDFANNFFAFTPYNVTENLEYALNLGDNSLQDAYLAFMSKNWYNDIIQNNLIQTIQFIDNPSIKANQNIYSIVVNARITIQEYSGASQRIEYDLSFSCIATSIKPSYPKFKQGLFISNFKYNITD